MKNDLDVIIYSYKGKHVKDVIGKVKKYSSTITLIDQHPLDRSEIFLDDVTNYRHVFWDWQNSPCSYKQEYIYKSKSKYILILSDNIIMNDGWYESFINFLNEKSIISGTGINKIIKKDLFSIMQSREHSSSYTLTNFINRDFIFTKSSLLKTIKYPDFVKYNGEEELLSLLLYSKNYNIYSAPSDFANTISPRTIETLYCPFSLDHKYNDVIKILKGESMYKDFSISKNIIEDFSRFHNFDFSSLEILPFSNDDVLYNPNQLNFLDVNGRKFVEKTRAIH